MITMTRITKIATPINVRSMLPPPFLLGEANLKTRKTAYLVNLFRVLYLYDSSAQFGSGGIRRSTC